MLLLLLLLLLLPLLLLLLLLLLLHIYKSGLHRLMYEHSHSLGENEANTDSSKAYLYNILKKTSTGASQKKIRNTNSSFP